MSVELAAQLETEFAPLLDTLGYDLTVSYDGSLFGTHVPEWNSPMAQMPCICADISPKVGSPAPSGLLLTRMRQRILPHSFGGKPVCKKYVP